MTNTAVKKPAPVVGQLKSGEWVVFNMEGTELWDKTWTGYRAEYNAFWALVNWYEKNGKTKWQAYLAEGRA